MSDTLTVGAESLMQGKRVLLVEDDRNIALSLEKVLQREGFTVCVARDGASAESFAATFKPDLVILDWMLPDRDGLDVLKKIRSLSATLVLFLTAKDDVSDKVLGLEMGADDYMTKPFHSQELVARLRSLLRRSNPSRSAAAQNVSHGPFEIQVDERRVTKDGEPIELTRIEFDLLLYFVRNPRVVLTRETLLQEVWGYDFEGYQRTVDTHVRRLRAKIEAEPDNPQFIHSVRGVGYRFEHSARKG